MQMFMAHLSPRASLWVARVIWAGLGFSAIVLLLATTTVFWPITTFSQMDIAVAPTHTGEPLRVTMTYCKRFDWVPDELRWALQDGVQIGLPPTTNVLKRGCHTVALLLETTPHMTPGTYRLIFLGVYRPFPWRAVYAEQTSHPFEVLP